MNPITTKEKELLDKIQERLVREISEKKAKILDDFTKAYLASRWDDYFSKQKKIDFRRLELVEQRKENGAVYFFRLKRGKLKSNLTH
jgi:hypothetical protein